MCDVSTRDVYTKLFVTAYHLAVEPTLPLSQFKTLVKVQRANGVRLIQGKYKSFERGCISCDTTTSFPGSFISCHEIV